MQGGGPSCSGPPCARTRRSPRRFRDTHRSRRMSARRCSWWMSTGRRACRPLRPPSRDRHPPPWHPRLAPHIEWRPAPCRRRNPCPWSRERRRAIRTGSSTSRTRSRADRDRAPRGSRGTGRSRVSEPRSGDTGRGSAGLRADRLEPPISREGRRSPTEWSGPVPSSEADRAGIGSALVSMRVAVDASGVVRDVELRADPGHGFGAAADRCARSKRWTPALDRQGSPVAGDATINVRFRRD